MVSDQNVRETRLESSTNSRDVCRACARDQNYLGTFFFDLLLQTRNLKPCGIIRRRVHQFINAASICIKNPVVDIHSRMEFPYRIDKFPAENSSRHYFFIGVWGPESHYEHICLFTQFDSFLGYSQAGIEFPDHLLRDEWCIRHKGRNTIQIGRAS